MKRSHSFQSFLQASPPSSLPETNRLETDSTLLQDSILSPPFYGRPYRLPPSPSFSELLKPQWHYSTSFSRSPSRDGPASGATTPESSDDESTIAKASEFAQSQSGKNDVGAVGTNEFYGFALYLGSSIAFCTFNLGIKLILVLYIGWAFLPSQALHFIGVYYYPDRFLLFAWKGADRRWWAVAIPSLAVITLVYIFAALQGYNRAITPSFDRLECITGNAMT
jgi:phosphatidylinositol glycan class P protein